MIRLRDKSKGLARQLDKSKENKGNNKRGLVKVILVKKGKFLDVLLN